MAEALKWRDAVKVVRGKSLDGAMQQANSGGRATAFEFSGAGGRETWIGTVTLQPDGNTGPHHHGRHEVALYVASGRSEIRWGDRLEYAADAGPGDLVYFAPYVPHQERNPSPGEAVIFLVVRSDNERIAVPVAMEPVDRSQMQT